MSVGASVVRRLLAEERAYQKQRAKRSQLLTDRGRATLIALHEHERAGGAAVFATTARQRATFRGLVRLGFADILDDDRVAITPAGRLEAMRSVQ
jgi:hypothetical protein